MNDLISRQAAIDALDTGLWGVEWDKALATAMLKDLPSVQPPARKGGKSMIEVIPEKITVADQIRGMNDQELNEFLFRFKLNACGCFIKKGGAGLFDVKQQLDLLQTDENLADLRDCEFSNCFPWRHNDDQ